MAAATSTKLYPRATVRRIIKAHSNCNVSKNADVLIYLNYVLFVEKLVREAGVQARMSGGEKVITGRNVRRVKKDCLRRFRA